MLLGFGSYQASGGPGASIPLPSNSADAQAATDEGADAVHQPAREADAVIAPNGEKALREAPEFARYQRELAGWMAGDSDEENALETAGAALCDLARQLAVRPEELIIALRDGRPAPAVQEGTDRGARLSQARAHRYTLAVDQLLRCYFT